MRSRIAAVPERLPWLVLEHDGDIAGYAHASPWKARMGYRIAVESSIQLAPAQVGRGFGSAPRQDLLDDLRARNIHCVIGGAAPPNAASVALHEKPGFTQVAHFRENGFKFGRWIEVAYWQRLLQPSATQPCNIGLRGVDRAPMSGLHNFRLPVTATLPLFEMPPPAACEKLAPGACVLRGFASDVAGNLLAGIDRLAARSPFRHLVTPGGKTMSVAMTNCGALGWFSDRRGYRYTRDDPETGAAWPAMPAPFAALARDAAHEAGFDDYAPDVCLVNRYEPGTRLTLHRDQDECDHQSPIVSVSLGLPATFLFGGFARRDPQQRVPLAHGDVVVWGGPSRMRYHGVLPIGSGTHPLTGARRYNLTFRVTW